MIKHLWEIEHDYYCEEENYFSDDTVSEFKSFQYFLDENNITDPSCIRLNLIFRWDWIEENQAGECNFNGDVNYRNGKLKLFYMGQRKGLYRSVKIDVCRADEPQVIEFLKPHWEYLKELWSPLNEQTFV